MLDLEQTILAQYANSPILLQLVRGMNEWLDPRARLDKFVEFVWNVQTAQSWGLDNIGRIVGISRYLEIAGEVTNFGFSEGVGCQPFDQAPFYDGPPASQTYELSDEAYRTLILFKALANISASSAQSLNRLLQNLFATRGRAYVTDMGGMRILFVFEFDLTPAEVAIVTNSHAMPRPAAVGAQAIAVDTNTTFGFSEADTWQPFDQGTFYPENGYLTVA